MLYMQGPTFVRMPSVRLNAIVIDKSWMIIVLYVMLLLNTIKFGLMWLEKRNKPSALFYCVGFTLRKLGLLKETSYINIYAN